MAETNGAAAPQQPRRVPPMIAVPPQTSFETLFAGGGPGPGLGLGFSPGPMTLISNFFSDHNTDIDCRSFSQLLAGAMASPASQILPPSLLEDCSSSKQSDTEKQSGFKQKRPMDLVIAQSPSGFMFPSMFSPSGFLNSPGFFSPLQSPLMSHQQALAHVTAQAALSQSYFNQSSQPIEQQQQPQIVNTKSDFSDSQIGSPDDLSVSQSDISEPRHVIDTNDGYNWRKYGQKQVKASEHPRSYYKCTHGNCPVKKKVGQSLDGHISDIVYKGQHNHDPPLPGKRGREGPGADVSRPINSQFETRVVEEPVPARDQHRANELIRLDESDDEPNPKRRNTEVSHVVAPVESNLCHNKVVAEPKIVVQTRSEVDLLDDGFKWRKYGQKVVKGNTNPRSYYKCTYAGCSVRKHVERAPQDPKSVVTTYEGKHNHDIPVSRHRGYNINNNNTEKGTTVKSSQSQRKETKFGSNNERPVLLQMKEEKITV